MRQAIRRHLPPLALLAGVLFLLFFRSFDPALTLSTGDASLNAIKGTYLMKHTLFTGTWVAANGLGFGGTPLALAPGFLLAWLVPFQKYVDANVILHLLLLGGGGYFLIHDIVRNRFAALAGGLFLMLQPHVFSHLLPGHVGHFIMAGWVPFAFLFVRRGIRQGGLHNWTLAGASFGLLLAAGQHDVAAFFGITLAAYGGLLLIRTLRAAPGWAQAGRLAAGLALAAALSLLIGAQALFANLIKQVRHHTVATTSESANAEAMSERDQWLWATQWSVPPVETLDSAVPGFFGWGSNSPDNPYRGRIGQTQDWLEHRQGLPNLNDVCQYLGAVLLLGALLAFRFRARDPETWFFTIAALLALLLAFGKFGPLYRFFYAIPGMNSLRNPIKWFYVTSLAAGILGAIGLAAAAERGDSRTVNTRNAALAAFLPALLVLTLAGLALAALRADPFFLGDWRFNEPAMQAAFAEQVLNHAGRAVRFAALFWLAAGGALFLILRFPASSRPAKAGFALALLVLAAELGYVNSHYLPYQEWRPQTQAGPFNDFLKNRVQSPFRFRFLRQDGVFHHLREVAAMQGIENADPYPARLPDFYLRLQRALEPRDPLKFWKLANVRYIVAHMTIGLPGVTPVFNLRAGTQDVVVHEFAGALPRCIWLSAWRAVPESDAIAALSARDFDPAREALLHLPPDEVPPPPGTPATPGSCRITRYTLNTVTVQTQSDHDGLVLSLTRHDPDWKVTVDGAPAPLWKANGLMQAVPVPAGSHTVEFVYAPGEGRPALLAALAGWALTLLLLLAAAALHLRRPARPAP